MSLSPSTQAHCPNYPLEKDEDDMGAAGYDLLED